MSEIILNKTETALTSTTSKTTWNVLQGKGLGLVILSLSLSLLLTHLFTVSESVFILNWAQRFTLDWIYLF